MRGIAAVQPTSVILARETATEIANAKMVSSVALTTARISILVQKAKLIAVCRTAPLLPQSQQVNFLDCAMNFKMFYL